MMIMLDGREAVAEVASSAAVADAQADDSGAQKALTPSRHFSQRLHRRWFSCISQAAHDRRSVVSAPPISSTIPLRRLHTANVNAAATR